MSFAFIFDSVGGTEWFVLLGVVLIVVGPKNLPSAARKLGNIVSTLRRAADEFKRQILSMDEEFRKTVDEAANDVTSMDSSGSTGSPTSSSSSDPAKPAEDDPSTVPDSEDRAEEEGSAYDYDSPYPGHDYYDETKYQPAASEAGSGETAATETAAPASQPSSAPAKPKRDPYEIKITVSTTAGTDKK